MECLEIVNNKKILQIFSFELQNKSCHTGGGGACFRPPPHPNVSFGDTGSDHHHPLVWRDNFHFTGNIAFKYFLGVI